MRARRQAKPGLSSFLFCKKPMDLTFLHFFFPLQLPGEQLGLLHRGTDIESALHHSAPPSPTRWLGGNPEIKNGN